MKKIKNIYALLSIIAVYILTRKKYYIQDFNIFIPNTRLLGIKQSNEDLITTIRKNINANFTGTHWIITINSINGFSIPYKAVLPFDAPVAIPQLIAQIGNNIKLEDVKKLGILVGKRLIIRGVSFYA